MANNPATRSFTFSHVWSLAKEGSFKTASKSDLIAVSLCTLDRSNTVGGLEKKGNTK